MQQQLQQTLFLYTVSHFKLTNLIRAVPFLAAQIQACVKRNWPQCNESVCLGFPRFQKTSKQ